MRDRSTWPRWARLLLSPWLLSPLVVVLVLVLAFVGYGVYTRSQPTTYARGGSVFAPSATPTASPTVSPGRRTPGAVSLRQSARAGAPPAQPTAAAIGGSAAPSNAPRVAPTQATAGIALPAVGVYGLAVTGSENIKFGPVPACDNTFPKAATLTVSKAVGEPPSSYDFDLRLYPNSPSKHDERHIYRYDAQAVTLTYEEATVTCSGVKQSSTVDYSPPQLRVRGPLSVGESWNNKGGDSSRTETAHSTVTGTQALTVEGRSYATFVITTAVTMSGSESGTRTQKWWWSPALGMMLEWSERLHGSRSGADYHENVTCRITSLP